MKIFEDIRANIGLILTIIGALILFTGLTVKPSLPALHGLNINLIWGLVTIAVGILFLIIYFKKPDGD